MNSILEILYGIVECHESPGTAIWSFVDNVQRDGEAATSYTIPLGNAASYTSWAPLMLWSAPTCPVDNESREWIEQRMRWLVKEFGRERCQSATVVLPIASFFPDAYDGSEASVLALTHRVCGYMGIDHETIHVSLYVDQPPVETDGLVQGTRGLYQEEDGGFRIWLEVQNLGDPLALVATIAHELGHVLLLGQGRISPDEADHEPLTDLLTVFLGLGVITSNAVVRESTLRMGHFSTWQMSRGGYLTMQQYGYALALFARLREEQPQKWVRVLRPDVKKAFKQGRKFLELHPVSFENSVTGRSPQMPAGSNEPELNAATPSPSIDQSSEELECSFCGAKLIGSDSTELVCSECRSSIQTNEIEAVIQTQQFESKDRKSYRILLGAIALPLIVAALFAITSKPEPPLFTADEFRTVLKSVGEYEWTDGSWRIHVKNVSEDQLLGVTLESIENGKVHAIYRAKRAHFNLDRHNDRLYLSLIHI